ncbi:MAG: hypothetical protein HUU18_11545 [Phycisphaerales bacterium]|nr:hypothetical protein [Phycisphaerales bacterium]
MKKSHCLLGFSAALALATAAFAQADDCASATAIGEGSFPYDTTGATPLATGGCFDGSNDMWFMYTPTGSGAATLSLCGSFYDTALSYWSACPANGGVQIGCNDDFCGLQSEIGGVSVTAGTPIWIRVHGFSTSFGAGTLTITGNFGGPPANDTCAAGTPVGEGSFAFDTTLSTDEGPAASCGFGGDPGSRDVFFTYTPTFTGTARIGTCGTAFDTIVQALSGCGGGELACNDDACGLQSQFTVATTSGVPMSIRISGYQGAVGQGTLLIEQVTCGVGNDCCLTPTVQNGPGSLPFDTTAATNDGTATCGASGTSPDIWFSYVPALTGNVIIETCGSFYDTVLSAHTGCGGAQIACNDDACGLQSRINVPGTAGVPMLIRLAGFAGQVGTGTITFIEPLPPANDACANAMAVGEGSYPIDTLAATEEGPAASCGFGGDPGTNDVFYMYTPSFTGTARFSTCGSGYDTILQVLSSCGGSELACNDDACGLQSQTNADVTANVPVWVRVSGYFGARGTGTLTIDQVSCGVGNDCCATADVIGVGSTAFDTFNATNDGSGTCGASGTSPDIWYSFTAPSGGTYTIDTCGSSYDTVLSAMSACYGAELACNDDSCGLQSSITLALAQGQTILLRVAGFAGQVGSGVLNIGSCDGITVPGGAVLENEVCGGDNNGGCNMGVPTFEPITPGVPVHGTAWASAGTRDTDWYSASFNAGDNITICGQAEFPLRLFILDNLCPPAILATIAVGPCTETSLSFIAPNDGTYHFFAGTSGFDGTPCNAGDVGNNYWISVSADGSCPEAGSCAPCVADFNNSGGTPDDADVAAFFDAWNAGDACADANGSGGTPDDADVATFFELWNAGGC